jgi:hypothetical protein
MSGLRVRLWGNNKNDLIKKYLGRAKSVKKTSGPGFHWCTNSVFGGSGSMDDYILNKEMPTGSAKTKYDP